MIETELINVPFSGTGIVPLISIGGAHKGLTYTRFDFTTFESVYENFNTDCIGSIFQQIDKEWIEDSEKRGFDLKKAIYEVMKKVWEDPSEYSVTKCYGCYTGKSIDDECYYSGEWGNCTTEFNNPNSFDLNIIQYNPADFCTFPSLKEFDLRREGKISLTCKIKNIQNPVLNGKKYTQNVILYDDDTNKTIKATFNDGVADFDKWHKGERIRLIGALNNDFERPVSIDYAVKIKKEVPPIVTNRNDETPGYNEWREFIVSRDGKCVCCGFDKHLEAHHMFGYKENPELAVNENNGVTLCKFCHDKYHSVYGLKDINPVDFVDFIKRFGVR